ncbi:Glc operon transcriptional activator (plasmid) [Caballeronia sp. SBC1]|uniref:FadR/GntR family transcriptional regulator n=1 Tax=unclassified Caballeronia TaxID=2646786 RepID=UPI0013E18222|nr:MULTISPECIES: FCD domain-containing protein [unclassified Caballeronia]QIE26493.1 Glc operon transcriptional activator [Caballeronia sp. SBC2]QIN64190.1 Glc operon transcriptional activator [Caballeronia sp. SBC1]
MSDVEAKSPVRAAGAKALAAYLHDEIASGRMRDGIKLPAERQLSEQFGASRGAVRRVLQDLKDRGLITQSVGSGTFVLPGAAKALPAPEIVVDEISETQTSPAELMEARLLIEPLMPKLIARNATSSDFTRMMECIDRSEAAQTVEEFEHWDGELHRTFALATHNSFFLKVLELTNRIREQGEWGRLKRHSLTPERRKEYEAQHRAIVEALRDRDAEEAGQVLTGHLRQIQHNLFGN